jgi:hypothetical protein
MIAAVVLAQYAGTLEIFDTTRIDARATQPLPILPSPPREVALAADAITLPTARLHLSDRRWDYTLTYSPTLGVTDIELGAAAQVLALNAGAASVAWHGRFVRVTVSESASYGVQSSGFINQYPQPSIPGQTTPGQVTAPGQTTAPGQMTAPGQTAVPGQTATATSAGPATLFPFGSSLTSGAIQVLANRRLTFSLFGGYSVYGDLTGNKADVEDGALPKQFGPSAAASVAYAVSRTDSLVTQASAQETTTPLGFCVPLNVPPPIVYCRQVQPIIQVQETVRHQLSTTEVLSMSAGASAAILPLTNEEAWGILPIGSLSFTDRIGTPKDPRDATTLLLWAGLAPMVDVRTGLLSNRVQPTATFGTRVAPNTFLSVTAGLLQSVPIPQRDPSPLTALNGGVDIRVRLTRRIDVSVGIQAYWQEQLVYGALPQSTTSAVSASEIGYLSLTAHAPTLPF